MLKCPLSFLDSQIEALEADLKNSDDDSSDDDGDSSSGSKEFSDIIIDESLVEVVNSEGNIIKMSSSILKDRIEPLPASMLPRPACAKVLSKPKSNRIKVSSASIKRVKFNVENKLHNGEIPDRDTSTGLKQTVDELLKNYQPSSSERRPHWCRICRFQGDSLENLESHRLAVLHKLATKKEKELSYCKVCRKQFTSVAQYQEHTKGKFHSESLEKYNSRRGKKFERI